MPAHSTVVGIPGEVVKVEAQHTRRQGDHRSDSADLPDPIAKALTRWAIISKNWKKKDDEPSAAKAVSKKKTAEETEEINRIKEALRIPEL